MMSMLPERSLNMRLLSRLIGLALIAVPTPAFCALKPGDLAPDFTTAAAVGGKDFTFALKDELKKGPVVVYFYPKSFTKGCTIEAHEFADHSDDFAAAGAALIGLSADTIEVQREFSTKECRDKFPVGADASLTIINAYDARRDKPSQNGAVVSDRISYVVTPDGKIGFALTSSNPVEHVAQTLEFARKWRSEHSK